MIITGFGQFVSDRMRIEHRALAARWFERLLDLLPVDARDVFPSDSLLDHVPALILEISEYVRQPEDDAIAANTAILEKARQLGTLRHGQRASLHQVLREYHLLGGVLVTFVRHEIERAAVVPSPIETALVISRVHEAVNVLMQSTVETFVELYSHTMANQTSRLEEFTRMAPHEWRQPLGGLEFGSGALAPAHLDPDRSRRGRGSVERGVAHVVELPDKHGSVARINGAGDNALIQEVSVASVAEEAARQVREMANSRDVQVRIASELPKVTVDVGRLELVFINLLSNAIKYSDPSKNSRYVEVTGKPDGEATTRIEVRDNGIGIPDSARDAIFQRFTRAHADRDTMLHVDGVGLGLSIVDDCVRALKGRIEVSSVEQQGTVFVVTIPISPASEGSTAQHGGDGQSRMT